MRIQATSAWVVGVGVLLTALALYALNVEPDWVEVTTHNVDAVQSNGLNRKIR